MPAIFGNDAELQVCPTINSSPCLLLKAIVAAMAQRPRDIAGAGRARGVADATRAAMGEWRPTHRDCDFNAEPADGAIKLVTGGRLPIGHPQLCQLLRNFFSSYNFFVFVLNFRHNSLLTLRHSRNRSPPPAPWDRSWEPCCKPMRSAYFVADGVEPSMTCMNLSPPNEHIGGFAACIDYVFISAEWDVRPPDSQSNIILLFGAG